MEVREEGIWGGDSLVKIEQFRRLKAIKSQLFFIFFDKGMAKILKGLKVYKIGYGGIGIASLSDGKKVLIKGGALPGSIVDVRIVKSKKDYLEAHLLEIKKYDANVVNGKPICTHFFSPVLEQAVEQAAHKIGC